MDAGDCRRRFFHSPPTAHMSLPSVTFDCEILTPTFLAGARQDGDPELRGPSLRGALRYWYRALLGGRGITEQDRLREQGAEIFGSPDRASPLQVRLLPYDVTEDKRKGASMIDELDESNTGTRYLWYFTHPTLTEKEDKYDPSEDRRYIVPGARFEVQLLVRPDLFAGEDSEEALREAARAFWLLAHLGGIGLRSRRMAGAFEADLVESPEHLELPSFDAPSGYDDWFTGQLQQFGAGAQSVSARPQFDALTAGHFGAWRLGISEDSWEDLVEAIGDKFESHRGDLDIPEKVGLGLPMVTPEGTESIDVTQNGTSVDRRASPLWLQAVRRPNGELDAVASFMESQFAAGGDRVRVSWEEGNETVDNPYRKLGTFVRDGDFESVSLFPARSSP